MKYKIDKEKCIGCGVCISIAPAAFDFDDDGKAKVTGDAPEADDAVQSCPTQAISE
ncbi:MAG: ferredoxin [Erysipelotrichaceae bacterium]|jgi:ferredoxin|nr:ferredoxin [Erysipelotrichaceae bacterium]